MGDNPIYGYSHFNQLLSGHQKEANTSDQVIATLRRAEEVGINAWQNSLTERSAADLQRYRDEGGAIHYFCLSPGGLWYDDPSQIDVAAGHGPIGMAPHGSGVAGRCLKENRLGHLRDILKRIRNTGAMVGLSVHNPRLIDIAEEEDWDIDYYMAALYYLEGAREEFERKFGYRLSAKSTSANIATVCAGLSGIPPNRVSLSRSSRQDAPSTPVGRFVKNSPIHSAILNPTMFFWWGCIRNSTINSAKTRR